MRQVRGSGGLCPVAGDASSVPSQQGVGRDEPAGSLWTRERCRDGAEQGPIVVVERGSAYLAAQYGVLVAQHDDLKVLPSSGAHREPRELGE